MNTEFDHIIIGATFTAAGIISGSKENCLILERRPQAGYEFFNAAKFGDNYDKNQLITDEAKSLFDRFEKKGAFRSRICLFDCAPVFYSCLLGKNVLLNMEITDIKNNDGIFEVTAHGVSGYRCFTAKKITDTTVHTDMILSKTLNVFVNSETEEEFKVPDGADIRHCGYEGDILLRCQLEPDDDYISARKKLKKVIEKMTSGYKVEFMADCFDYTLKEDIYIMRDGVFYLPSCAYQNPLLAFDAGVIYGRDGGNA